MAERVDCLVIGAGVVGLAIARHLAMIGREVIVVEAESSFGLHTSSRNSGVIHAGLADVGSLKRRLCLRGKELLYRYCADHAIPHRRIGKLIVAPASAGAEGVEALLKIEKQAQANGLFDLKSVTRPELRDMEPEVDAPAALFSPSSGIVDATELMRAFLGDLEDHGGVMAPQSPVLGGEARSGEIEILVGGAHPITTRCASVVNCAGFNAPLVAASIKGVPAATIPPRFLAKGSYFTLVGKSPFNHLIYPVHTKHFRSLHCTLDLAGALRFGPDVEWIDEVDYRIDEQRGAYFYEAARQFWPSLPDGSLVPGWAGVRPKIAKSPVTGESDFIIQGPQAHGIAGLINLYGIESPGLTASLAIAEEVAGRLH